MCNSVFARYHQVDHEACFFMDLPEELSKESRQLLSIITYLIQSAVTSENPNRLP